MPAGEVPTLEGIATSLTEAFYSSIDPESYPDGCPEFDAVIQDLRDICARYQRRIIVDDRCRTIGVLGAVE